MSSALLMRPQVPTVGSDILVRIRRPSSYPTLRCIQSFVISVVIAHSMVRPRSRTPPIIAVCMDLLSGARKSAPNHIGPAHATFPTGIGKRIHPLLRKHNQQQQLTFILDQYPPVPFLSTHRSFRGFRVPKQAALNACTCGHTYAPHASCLLSPGVPRLLRTHIPSLPFRCSATSHPPVSAPRSDVLSDVVSFLPFPRPRPSHSVVNTFSRRVPSRFAPRYVTSSYISHTHS
ncbi:hypothetical protein OH77DRAFT_1244436 [Trametes cingulata]|nr:hypothetical protein OH77DRAFT_1244436 [Trametes cingulata]